MVARFVSTLLEARVAGFVVAAILAATLFAKATHDFPYQFGIDFYQFWGVPTAHRSLVTASPYVDPSGYARALNGIADASDNAKLKHANSLRRELETMATPFFYASFAFVAEDYERAQILHTWLLYMATGLGVFLLARLREVPVWASVCLALLVDLTFNPFVQDVKYGNVSSLQFLYTVAMLRMAARGLYPRNAAVEALVFASLALFVIFKPTTLWIALAFAVHYAIVRGWRRLAAGAAASAVLGVLALACGAWFFHDANVWLDWFRFTQGANGGSLVRTLEQGNLSIAMLLSQRSMHYSLLQYALMIAGWLALALVLAMTAMGRRTELLRPTARRCFSDPWLALSIGILFTLATSPLVWAYYVVFALIPMFGLARMEGRWKLKIACVAISYLTMANPVLELIGKSGHAAVIPFIMLWSWIPLLVAVLAEVVERRRAVTA